jgi:hypothetical protein
MIFLQLKGIKLEKDTKEAAVKIETKKMKN